MHLALAGGSRLLCISRKVSVVPLFLGVFSPLGLVGVGFAGAVLPVLPPPSPLPFPFLWPPWGVPVLGGPCPSPALPRLARINRLNQRRIDGLPKSRAGLLLDFRDASPDIDILAQPLDLMKTCHQMPRDLWYASNLNKLDSRTQTPARVSLHRYRDHWSPLEHHSTCCPSSAVLRTT